MASVRIPMGGLRAVHSDGRHCKSVAGQMPERKAGFRSSDGAKGRAQERLRGPARSGHISASRARTMKKLIAKAVDTMMLGGVALAQGLRSLRFAGRFARAWSLRERRSTLLSVSAARRHHEARVHDERGDMRVAPVISLLICLVGTAAFGQTDRAAPSALAASSPSTAVVLTCKRDKRTKHREWRMKRHLQAQRKGGSSEYTLPPNLGIGIGLGM
jgi:hypothetical protein